MLETANSADPTEDVNKFASPQEEILFLKKKLDECQNEFVEFQESSRELELEYETQIKQLEKKQAASSTIINRLENENELLKSRHNGFVNDTQHRLQECQTELAGFKEKNNKLTTYIIELEQSNDKLEGAKRNLQASLQDLDSELNKQIERNVLLENELSEKDELECLVQRLKEECRDLRQELRVNQQHSSPQVENEPSTATTTTTTINTIHETVTNSNLSPQTRNSIPGHDDSTTNVDTNGSYSEDEPNSSKINDNNNINGVNENNTRLETDNNNVKNTPSSGMSAVGLVTELLRRLGALESRLNPRREHRTNN